MSNHSQTFRTLNTAKATSNNTASIVLVVCVTLMLIALCGGVLVFSWPANMEAEYQGFGLLGAFAPVVAIFGAFFVGIATALTMRGD